MNPERVGLAGFTSEIQPETDAVCVAQQRVLLGEEVGEIAGVDAVSADHTTGAVSVSGSDFTDEQVAAAVAEAGYTLK